MTKWRNHRRKVIRRTRARFKLEEPRRVRFRLTYAVLLYNLAAFILIGALVPNPIQWSALTKWATGWFIFAGISWVVNFMIYPRGESVPRIIRYIGTYAPLYTLIATGLLIAVIIGMGGN